MEYNHKSIMALAIAVTAFTSVPVQAATIDNFNSVDTSSGSVNLANVSGWSTTNTSSTNIWTVASGTGVGGSNGVVTGVGSVEYVRTLSSGEAIVAADGTKTFTMDIKLAVNGEDRFKTFEILAGQSGGTNGFLIQFYGGSNKGAGDNYIVVSTGGASWGTGTTRTLNSSNWQLDTWYTIQLTFATQATGIGNNVTGTLSIFETGNSSSVLVANETVVATGQNGAFSTLDYLRLKDGASGRLNYVDNIAVVPEPGSLSLLFAGLPILCKLCRR